MAQASKRNRELYGMKRQRTTAAFWSAMREVAEPPELNIADKRIWINRTVYGLSISELKDAARVVKREEAKAKFARFTLSVVIPGEIYSAINTSGRSNISPALIAERLFQDFPESTKRNVIAETSELKQFGDFISVEANYDSFEEERAFVSEYLSTALGIHHEWQATPHISLARGSLKSISNLDEVNEAIPHYIQLGPVQEQ